LLSLAVIVAQLCNWFCLIWLLVLPGLTAGFWWILILALVGWIPGVLDFDQSTVWLSSASALVPGLLELLPCLSLVEINSTTSVWIWFGFVLVWFFLVAFGVYCDFPYTLL